MKEKGVEPRDALSKVEILGQKLKGFNLKRKSTIGFFLSTQLNPETHFSYVGGVTGVFDIDELVDVLRRENCFDIVTLAIPKHVNYVDYIVVTSCRSSKHCAAVAEFTKKLFKQKMDPVRA